MRGLREIPGFLKEIYAEWNDDKVPRLGAALAYYTIFSLAPFLIIVIAIAGLVFGREAVSGQVVGQIQGLVGQEGATDIQEIISRASQPRQGIIATIIGVGTLILGATGLFGQLQDALNTIWGVRPRPDLGIKGTIYARLTSFAVVLGVAFLLLVTLVLSTALAAFGDMLSSLMPGEAYVVFWQVINFLISLAITTLLFAMIYKILPDVRIAWSDVWIGALVTAVLFSIGRYLISIYIGNSDFSQTYGASAAVIVIILWVYFASQIVLLGAEFTFVYARRYGSQIVPDKHAVALTEAELARQGIPRRQQLEQAAREQP